MMAFTNWPQREFINISPGEKDKHSCDTRSKTVEETRQQMQAFLQQFNKYYFMQCNKHKTLFPPLESICLRTHFLSVNLEFLKLKGQRKAAKVYCQNILFGMTCFIVSSDYVHVS